MGKQFITYKSILGYIIGALNLILLLWIWFGTGCQVKDELLTIKVGPFKSKKKIKEIRKIRRIKKSPTQSTVKLEIHLGKYDVISISPIDESELINSLLAVNPNIQIVDERS